MLARMIMTRFVLALCAAGFAVFGVWMLLFPVAGFAMLGVAVQTADFATEIRAFYGGLELALAALIARGMWRADRVLPALEIAAVAYGCVAASRLLGLLLDGSGATWHWVALGSEATLAAAAAFCWWHLTRRV
jgi:hypothetical protein